MALYGPPPNVGVGEGLYLIFSHYCNPRKPADIDGTGENTALAMDGASFARLCREAPELNKYIGRTDIDVIFSKTRAQGMRRLQFDNFLDTLLELAVRIYPNDDPCIALANFLAKFIFALFDQPPSADGVQEIERILDELVLTEDS